MNLILLLFNKIFLTYFNLANTPDSNVSIRLKDKSIFCNSMKLSNSKTDVSELCDTCKNISWNISSTGTKNNFEIRLCDAYKCSVWGNIITLSRSLYCKKTYSALTPNDSLFLFDNWLRPMLHKINGSSLWSLPVSLTHNYWFLGFSVYYFVRKGTPSGLAEWLLHQSTRFCYTTGRYLSGSYSQM